MVGLSKMLGGGRLAPKTGGRGEVGTKTGLMNISYSLPHNDHKLNMILRDTEML